MEPGTTRNSALRLTGCCMPRFDSKGGRLATWIMMMMMNYFGRFYLKHLECPFHFPRKLLIPQQTTPNNRHARRTIQRSSKPLLRARPRCKLRRMIYPVRGDIESSMEPRHLIRDITHICRPPTQSALLANRIEDSAMAHGIHSIHILLTDRPVDLHILVRGLPLILNATPRRHGRRLEALDHFLRQGPQVFRRLRADVILHLRAGWNNIRPLPAP